MSITAFSAAVLAMAAQFGQPGFPTQAEVEGCLKPTLTVLIVAMESEDAKMKEVEPFFLEAFAKYNAWDLYYDGRRFDDADFQDVSNSVTETLAKEVYAHLTSASSPGDTETGAIVDKAFACVDASQAHPLILNRDGSSEES